MKIRAEQIKQGLNHRLLPIYLIYGDESLLVQDTLDILRTVYREKGYDERVTLDVESAFNWQQLTHQAQTMSLFSEKRCIELRISHGKVGKEGSEALCFYAESPPPDTLLLIICGKLETSHLNSKWYKALDKIGGTVPHWPIEYKQMPAWVARRSQQQGIHITTDATQVLIERNEGNLLAITQEIQKLALVAKNRNIDIRIVEDEVSDNAHFNVFAFVDSLLIGKISRSLRILHRLKHQTIF